MIIRPINYFPTCDSGGCSSSTPITSIVEGTAGPKGPTGDTGATGATGTAGAVGLDGNNGAVGADGVDGVAIFDYNPTGGYTNDTSFAQVLSASLDLNDFLETIGNEIKINIYGEFYDVSAPDSDTGIYQTEIKLNSATLMTLSSGDVLHYKYDLEITIENTGSGNVKAYGKWFGKSQSGTPNLIVMKLNSTAISAGLTSGGTGITFLMNAKVADADKKFIVDNAVYVNYKQ